jgi:hypothetical protein
MHNFPFSPYTSGWFQVGWSGEYTSGDVRPLRYFGQDLVCYRTMTGGLMIADAYCPHLGAGSVPRSRMTAWSVHSMDGVGALTGGTQGFRIAAREV